MTGVNKVNPVPNDLLDVYGYPEVGSELVVMVMSDKQEVRAAVHTFAKIWTESTSKRVPLDIMNMLQYPCTYQGVSLTLSQRAALHAKITSLLPLASSPVTS